VEAQPAGLRKGRQVGHRLVKSLGKSIVRFGKSIIPLGKSIVRVTARRATPGARGAMLGKSIVPNDRLPRRLYARQLENDRLAGRLYARQLENDRLARRLYAMRLGNDRLAGRLRECRERRSAVSYENDRRAGGNDRLARRFCEYRERLSSRREAPCETSGIAAARHGRHKHVLVVPSPQLPGPLQQDSLEEHGWPLVRQSPGPLSAPVHTESPWALGTHVPAPQQTVYDSQKEPMGVQLEGDPSLAPSAGASEPESGEPGGRAPASLSLPASDRTGLDPDEHAMTKAANPATPARAAKASAKRCNRECDRTESNVNLPSRWRPKGPTEAPPPQLMLERDACGE